MSTTPSVYSLGRGESQSLYLGELSTVAGLRLLPPEAPIRLSEFGAYLDGGADWLAASDLPTLDTVSELVDFLEAPDTLGALDLIDLVVHVGGVGKLATHDDGECSFTGLSESAAMSLVAATASEPLHGPVWRSLVAHPGFFVAARSPEPWPFYFCFQDWVEERHAWHVIVEHHQLSNGGAVLIVEPSGPSLPFGINVPVELKSPNTEAVRATASRQLLLHSAEDGVEVPVWHCTGLASTEFPPGSLVRFCDKPAVEAS